MFRLRALLAPAALCVVGLALMQSTPVAAESGGLYGLSFPWSLATVDPATGTATTVQDLSALAPNEQVEHLTVDPVSRRLFAVLVSCNPCGRRSVLSYSVVTIAGNSVHVSPTLATPIAAIAPQPGGMALWAVTNCFTCASQSIDSVNPMTGAETSVAAIPVSTFGPVDSLSLAPDSQTLYLSIGDGGAPGLLSLDTRTGTFTSSVNLDSPLSATTYDSVSHQLFGITTLAGTPQLAQVDAATGNEIPVATVPAYDSLDNLAIDAASHTIFAEETDGFTGVETILSIDDQTGQMSASSPTTVMSLAFMPPPGVADTAVSMRP